MPLKICYVLHVSWICDCLRHIPKCQHQVPFAKTDEGMRRRTVEETVAKVNISNMVKEDSIMNQNEDL